MGIYPGFTNERFGAKYSGVNYGIMFIGFAVSGFCAPNPDRKDLSCIRKLYFCIYRSDGAGRTGNCTFVCLQKNELG